VWINTEAEKNLLCSLCTYEIGQQSKEKGHLRVEVMLRFGFVSKTVVAAE
jgi:hypothetical protein